MIPLFDSDSSQGSQEQLEEGAMLLRAFAAAEAPALVDEVALIAKTAAFRHMVTPGGYTMSVAMTNCGRLGWVSDRTGYRYTPVDPTPGRHGPRCLLHSSTSPYALPPRPGSPTTIPTPA
jgi:DNA oxidative demethylase